MFATNKSGLLATFPENRSCDHDPRHDASIRAYQVPISGLTIGSTSSEIFSFFSFFAHAFLGL